MAKGKGGTGDGSGPAVRHSSSRFGWYAAQVQRSIGEELRKNKKTRTADFVVMVRIWPDSTGRIERAKLGGTTGDAGVDAALINEVLPGLQLQEPPPAGLRLPIIMRLTARRPG